MSLINDALKRARQSQQKTPPSGPMLFPAEIRTPGGIGWFLPAVIIALVFTAGIFIALALARHTPPPPAAIAPVTAATQQIISATQQIESAAASVSAPVSNAPPAVFKTNAAAISNSAPPLPTPPPPPPEPKLQGIIFTPPRPWAIVNGKTVYVGDHVGDFHVKEITRNTVTLQSMDGSEKTLVMGQ